MPQRDPFPLGYTLNEAGQIVENWSRQIRREGKPAALDIADRFGAEAAIDALMGPHRPCRGDDVEVWIKRMRDRIDPNKGRAFRAIDELLDRYRECSDYGLSLRPEDDHLGDP